MNPFNSLNKFKTTERKCTQQHKKNRKKIAFCMERFHNEAL